MTSLLLMLGVLVVLVAIGAVIAANALGVSETAAKANSVVHTVVARGESQWRPRWHA